MSPANFFRRCTALIIAAAAAGGFVTGPAQATQDSVSPMVVGGTRAPAGAYPWMVRLSMGCGGALVGARVVLTAAHCVGGTGANTSLTATIGKVDLQASGGQVIRSTYVYRAPEYASTNTQDWALVELASAPSAAPLKFAAPGDTSLHNGDFTVMGWGNTSEGGVDSRYLMHATVPYVDDTRCAAVYGSTFKATYEICAGYDQGGIDTCQNDSGGPMVKRNTAGEWVEIGIVSYGRGCARPGVPGVYAEVQALSTKIRARISPDGTVVR